MRYGAVEYGRVQNAVNGAEFRHAWLHLLAVIRNHFFLKEAPHALPEDVVLLSEDASGPDVHQGVGAEGFWTGGGGGPLRRPTGLKPGRMAEMICDMSPRYQLSLIQILLCNICCKSTLVCHIFSGK